MQSSAEAARIQRRMLAARTLGLALGAICLAAVASCGLLSAAQGNPADPILVRGRVLDASGAPVGSAPLQLVVNGDAANVPVGGVVPMVFQASYTANLDGSFAIHLSATQALADLAAGNGGFVNFSLYAPGPGHSLASWAFPRQLTSGSWAGDVPEVDLKPIGSN
jgi:hypothetical protein